MVQLCCSKKPTNKHEEQQQQQATVLAAKTTTTFAPQNFEDILNVIKPNGLWQFGVLFCSITALVLLAAVGLGQGIFLVGQMSNACYSYADGSYARDFIDQNSTDSVESVIKQISCTSPRGSRCSAWNYTSPYYTSTMVSEWNLVCDRSYLRSVYQSCFLAGYLIGMAIFGALSDAFGRTFVIRLIWPLILLSYAGTTWTPAFWLAVLLRMFYGALSGGYWKANFVLIMELMVPQKRDLMLTILGQNFVFGGIVVSLIGYWCTNWRTLQLVGMLVALTSFPFMIVLPESPRWLVTQEKYARAKQVLQRAARINRTRLPENVDFKKLHDAHQTTTVKMSAWQRVAVLFATRKLLLRTLVFFVVWFSVATVYYGVTFYATGVMPGSPHWTFGLMSISRLPFVPVQAWTLKRFGARNTVISWLWASAVLLASLGPFPAGKQATVQVVFCVALVIGANIFIDYCFAAVYILTGEMYPTINRQTGVSMCSMVARLGGGISPFIANSLGERWRPFPAVIFAAMCVFASVFVFAVPSVKNAVLPDSVCDAAKVGATSQEEDDINNAEVEKRAAGEVVVSNDDNTELELKSTTASNH